MMLTGTTAQRDLLRKKTLSHEDITETRIVRGARSQGFRGRQPGAEDPAGTTLDRWRAERRRKSQMGEDADGRTVTVLTPVVATSDFRGTNCLTCHVVAEGTVLGAVRVSYSLAAFDRADRPQHPWSVVR